MADKEATRQEVVKEQTTNQTPAKNEKFVAPAVQDPFKAVKFVLMTEKSVHSIEKENKMVFVVDIKAGKKTIKDSVETMFNAPVSSVTTAIDQKRRKRAHVKFKESGAAGGIAIKLGIL